MKKIHILIIYFFITISLFADVTIFKSKDDFILTDNIIHTDYSFNKNDSFKKKSDKTGFGVETKNPLTMEICLYSDKYDENLYIPLNNVYLDNNRNLIPKNINKDYWIPSYYYDLLKSNNIKNDILKYEPYLKNIDYTDEGDPIPWYLYIAVQRIYFGDFFFVSFGSNAYNDVDFFAYLEETSDNKIIYNVQKMYSHYFDYKRQTIYNQPEFLPLYEKQTPFKIIFTIDGDYMNMYIDKVDEKNLFQTLVRTSPEACDQIENYILGKSNDLSKVVMPKHENNTTTKTSSTTSQKTFSNVSVNKTMTVSENLKLRSGEATTTSVLTVMSAGTKVKILELGKAETIDGKNSNWVKVEVISGKDRDGKEIKKGITGWCYGGYLQ